jgi:DNA-binding XRE family transcriptional regulator
MKRQPPFTLAQYKILQETAKKVKRGFAKQEEMALALGITQQSLSALIAGRYNPGLRVAVNLANLAERKLEDLIGPYDTPSTPSTHEKPGDQFLQPGMHNLDICVRFHLGVKAWSAWTIAAARAGFFGPADHHPSEWARKLDTLEGMMQKARAEAKIEAA